MATFDDFDFVYTQTGRYSNEFTELQRLIGMGGNGAVYKARHNIDNKEYAIKQVLIANKCDHQLKTRELKIWAQLDTEYFVQYRSSWLECPTQDFRDYLIELLYQTKAKINVNEANQFKMRFQNIEFRILHIQMDLCSFSLIEAFNKIIAQFNLKQDKMMPKIPYYIISELMIEILISIEYLHSMKIIHRDIKPDNILIKKGHNAKFLKLADFGLAVTHFKPDELYTFNAGTERYMSPEVKKAPLVAGTNKIPYDMKADVFSIGVMGKELFNFDISPQRDIIWANISDKRLKQNYRSIMNIIGNAISKDKDKRPTCAEFLSWKSHWALELKDVRDEINVFMSTQNVDPFLLDFLQTKIDFENKNSK